MTSLYERLGVWIGYAVGWLICEPQLRLGRRRHDNDCDRCSDAIGRYACERLEFGHEPDADISTRERLRAMLNAEYERYCLECTAVLEDE